MECGKKLKFLYMSEHFIRINVDGIRYIAVIDQSNSSLKPHDSSFKVDIYKADGGDCLFYESKSDSFALSEQKPEAAANSRVLEEVLKAIRALDGFPFALKAIP